MAKCLFDSRPINLPPNRRDGGTVRHEWGRGGLVPTRTKWSQEPGHVFRRRAPDADRSSASALRGLMRVIDSASIDSTSS